MATSTENSLSDFDLDLLLCPASTSITESTEIRNNGFQVDNMGIADHTDYIYQTQNLGNTATKDQVYQGQNVANQDTTGYGYQTFNMENTHYKGQNMENELFLPNYEMVKKSDYDALQNRFDTKQADYEALKKQYSKLGLDYLALHKENKSNAMGAINARTTIELLESEVTAHRNTIKAYQNQHESLEIMNLAQKSSIAQFTNLVEKLQNDAAKLKNDVKSEKMIGKDGRKMISSLKSNNQTLAEHLCLFACVIEGRSPLEKEVRRLIKKYCKKSTSGSKKSLEEEHFENHSVDTGRGSSLAEDRSLDSLTYSINFSPLSVGNITHNEHTKIMNDASSSPLPMTKTSDISTSPIIFEETITNTQPVIKTFDVSTSPVYFEDNTSMAKKNTCEVATSTIECAVVIRTPVVKTCNIATSPVEFADIITPVVKTKSFTIATSPIHFADPKPAESKTTMNIATSPIEFAENRSQITEMNTMKIAVSPLKFADLRSQSKIKTTMLDVSTSSKELDEKISKVSKTNPIENSTTAIKVPDTLLTRSPVSKTKTIEISNTPIELDDKKSPAAKTKTKEISNTPIEHADIKSLVAQTKLVDSTRPMKCPTISPLAQTKALDIIKPMELVDTISKTCTERVDAQISVTNSKTMLKIKPIDHTDLRNPGRKSKIENTSPVEFIDARTQVKKNSLNFVASNCNTGYIQEREYTLIAKSTNHRDLNRSSQVSHIHQNIKEKLKLIQAQNADYCQDDERNDLEIKMILSKQSLNWDMLSPLSLTPEVDQKNEQIISESNVINKEQGTVTSLTQREIDKETDFLLQSLHISGDENSDDEVDREDCNFSDLSIPSPQQPVVRNDNVFDHLKNLSTVEKCQSDTITNKIKTSLIEDVSKSPTEMANKSYAKTNKPRGSSTNNKKLTKLQKIYKANIPKYKLNPSPSPKSKPSPFPPNDDLASVLHSNVKKKQVTELMTNSLLFNKKDTYKQDMDIQDTVAETCKDNVKCSFKKPPPLRPKKIVTELQTNSDGYKIPHIQPESCLQRECLSAETQSSLLPESRQQTRVCMSTVIQSNKSGEFPHTAETLLPECGRKRRHYVAKETQSHSKNEPKINPLPECDPSLCISTELIKEDGFRYASSKPPTKRIARVGKNVLGKSPSSNKTGGTETDKNSTKERICGISASDVNNKDVYDHYPPSPPSKKRKTTNDLVTSDSLDTERTRIPFTSPIHNVNQIKKQVSKEENGGVTSEMANYSVSDKHGLKKTKEKNQRYKSGKSFNIGIADVPDDISHPISATIEQTRQYTDYNDMNMFATQTYIRPKKQHKNKTKHEWKHNLMDRMIFKYGANSKQRKKPICDSVLDTTIETGIINCVKSSQKPGEYRKVLQELVNELNKHNYKNIIDGIMALLTTPARRKEFVPEEKFPKKGYVPIPTKFVMALIDVIQSLENSGTNLWKLLLDSCEYVLFTLEKGATPNFDVVASVTHLYVNICKYLKNHSKIWMFMLNAMYCLSFKAVTLIRHCLDMVPRLLPLSNTYKDPGLGSIIRCMVFLLHYYNCDDPFQKVQELRIRLKNRYNYELQDENETTILCMLKEAIINLTENKVERRMLELSLLIMAKRRGTKWCHKNIVQQILLPMIKGEIEVSDRAKRFCVIIIGEIMKPYKNEMTVHTEEVVNILMNMFEQSQNQDIKEDILRGLINMNIRTTSECINKCMFNWNPPNVSPEFEEALAAYIQSRSMRNWLSVYQSHFKEI